MLEAFRTFSQKNPIVFKILFGILVLSFGFSGMRGISRLSFSSLFGNNYVVKVGHEAITQEIIDKQYDNTVRNIRRSGMDLTDEQLATFGISKGQILRSMIQDSLIHQEVNDLGIQAGDQAVADQLKNDPEFQTNGAFNREKFNALIASIGKNENQYTDSLREKIRQNLVFVTIANNTPINDFVAKKQAATAAETRDVEVAIIPKSFQSTHVVEPTDKDLKDYYNDNSFHFQVPESRDFNYVTLPKGNDKANYETVTKIQDEIAGGSTLKEIANKFNLKLMTKTDVHKDDKGFSARFMETAFGKDKGELAEVSDDKTGDYSVIEITDVKPARIPDLSEVKEQVVADWKENNANDQNLKYIEKMADELKTSNGSLQSFAASNGYKYQVITDIKRDDTETYGARLVNAAFDSKAGDVLGAYQNEDGSYKIAKLKNIKQAKLSAEEQAKNKQALENAVHTEIMDEYYDALHKEFPLKQGDEVAEKPSEIQDGNDIGVADKKKGTLTKLFKKQ